MSGPVCFSWILLYQQRQVFRELLQNSDDASATAVEIHFETKEYLDRKNNKESPSDDNAPAPGTDGLPDLKTTMVQAFYGRLLWLAGAHRTSGPPMDVQKQRDCFQR